MNQMKMYHIPKSSLANYNKFYSKIFTFQIQYLSIIIYNQLQQLSTFSNPPPSEVGA